MERLIRSRYVRLALAIFLIGVASWALFPYLTHRVATSAFVNAEMVRVTAPFGGQVSPELPRKGDYFAASAQIKLVKALSPDRRQLLSLEQQYALAKEHAELARVQLAEIANADQRLAAQAEQYQIAIAERLATEIDGARADRLGCLAQEHQQHETRLRSEMLATTGYASQARVEEAQASHRVTAARCDATVARIRQLELQIEAAQRGVFVQDGVSDVPYSQQQRDRLMLRRQELEGEALRERARAVQLEAELTEERSRVERLSRYDVSVPANHVVWSVAASAGSTVVEGQPILDLANCHRRFVVVEIPERDFETIMPGHKAAVRLLGSDDWSDGYVQQVRGSAARADERLLPAQAQHPSGRNITVEVTLAADSDHNDASRFCDIGRLAEVRFDRLELNLLERAAGLFRRLPNFAKIATAWTTLAAATPTEPLPAGAMPVAGGKRLFAVEAHDRQSAHVEHGGKPTVEGQGLAD